MEQQKRKRLVLTSVNQVLLLVKTNPVLAEKIPKFSTLLTLPPSTAPKKSCNCGGSRNFTTPDANKQITESILSNLGADDFAQIKSILALDELCYYKRDTVQNKLEMTCI